MAFRPGISRTEIAYIRYLGRMGRGSMGTLQLLDYSKGIQSYPANDVVPQNALVYATDARISTLGRYITRQGADPYSVALGTSLANIETSVTGAADQTVSPTTWIAQKFTAGSTARVPRVDIRIKNSTSGTGEVRVELWSDSSGNPGTLISQSSIAAASLTSSYQYLPAYFIDAPLITNASVYWIVVYVQDNGTNNYNVASTTHSALAATSSNSGTSWATQSYSINYQLYNCTNAPTLGLYRAVKTDGTRKTLLATGTNLYTISDVDGSTTSIKSGLSASATDYRFETANNIVYYVNGFDAPRKWDFTTEAANPASPQVASNIKLFKNQMFYVDATNPTRMYWSDLGSFETFTTTNFLYVPSTFSPDPITALQILNDNLYIYTRSTKYVLQGSDISNFSLKRSTGLKGTPRQEATAATRNFIFSIADDGIYQFNGATDKLISGAVTDKINQIADINKVVLQVYRNRLYVFYPPSGSALNTQCLVYNLDWESWESVDLNAYVGRAIIWNSDDSSGRFVLGSNVVGAAYYNELSTNSYNNLGKPLTWELRTRYEHFNAPASQKDIRYWYPRFQASAGNYTVFCQVDKDFAGSPTTVGFDFLRGAGQIWGSGITWGNFTWGAPGIITNEIDVPGMANYFQLRFQRPGVNMPVEFAGHTLMYSVKRSL